MMKRIPAILSVSGLLLLGTCVLLAETISEGESAQRLNESNVLLSARLVRVHLARNTQPMPEGPTVDAMTRIMLADPGKCVSVKQAEELCRREFKKIQQEYVRKTAETALRTFRSQLSGKEWASLTEPRPEEMDQAQKQIFPRVFSSARQKAVAQQRSTLAKTVWPTEAEVERYPDQKLIELMTDRCAKKAGTVLFDENKEYLKKDSFERILWAARAQKKRQIEFLEHSHAADDLWEPNAIRKTLLNHLANDMKQWKEPHVWGIFPSAEKTAQSRALQVTADRVASAIPDNAVKADYEMRLRKETGKHYSAGESFSIMRNEFRESTQKKILKNVSIPDQYRSGLSRNPELKKRFDVYFDRNVQPEYAKIRKTFSAEQFRSCFPGLESGKLLPDMAYVEQYASSNRKSLPGTPAFAKRDLLEETVRLRDQSYRALLDKGAVELAVQLKAVNAVYDEVLKEMQAADGKDRSSVFLRWFGLDEKKITLDTVIRAYEEHVLKEFQKEQERMYADMLFPSVKKEIAIRAKTILANLKDADSPTPVQDEEKEEVIPCTVKLQMANGNLSLTVNRKRLNGSWKSGDPNAINRLAETLLGELERISRESGGKKTEIRLLISGPVYYYEAAALRELLKSKGKFGSVTDSPDR